MKKIFGFGLIILSALLSYVQVYAEEAWKTALANSNIKQNTGSDCLTGVWVIAVLLAVVITALVYENKIKKVKKKNELNKMTDSITKVGNLAYFKNYFETSVFDFSRSEYFVAYIIIDSNYITAYYDGLSFDDVLLYTAEAMSAEVDSGETVARITETGFAIIFRADGKYGAKEKISGIIKKLNDYAGTIENNKPIFHAAIYQIDKKDKSSEMVLFNLRINCSKIVGTTEQVIVCENRFNEINENEREKSERFRRAMKDGEFKLYVQFLVDNKTKEVVSAEALSRWDKPDEGIVAPGAYIGELENLGLITQFDYYMFDKVCKALEQWKGSVLEKISLSCNLTRITISDENFVEVIKNISDKYSFNKNKLIIEITEDAMEKNRKMAMRNIKECKNLGFVIALDDMGCGYTSLINLCEYPIDVVKIDREILFKTITNNGKKLFEGIVALVHSLNLRAVCEGVETAEHNEFVTESDCDYIQGWYFSGVIPAEEGEDFVKNYKNSSVIISN